MPTHVDTALQAFLKELRELGKLPLTDSKARNASKKRIASHGATLGNYYEVELSFQQGAHPDSDSQKSAVCAVQDAVRALAAKQHAQHAQHAQHTQHATREGSAGANGNVSSGGNGNVLGGHSSGGNGNVLDGHGGRPRGASVGGADGTGSKSAMRQSEAQSTPLPPDVSEMLDRKLHKGSEDANSDGSDETLGIKNLLQVCLDSSLAGFSLQC